MSEFLRGSTVAGISVRGRVLLTRYSALAWAVLVLCVAGRLWLTWFSPNGGNLVDLHVYVDGAASVFSGELYDFEYLEDSPDFPLPFTYPPFAAILFYPLHFLPFGFVAVVWQLLTVAALYGVVRIAMTMTLGDDARDPAIRTAAVLWTALGMWLEPVRSTLDYGQVNVFLVLAVLAAARSSRWWVSGLLVGVATGLKLTPAITGLYFLARRQWLVVVASVVAFGATVLASLVIIRPETRRYFGDLIGDADRIGPVGSAANQSLRGMISRLAGHDIGTGPVMLLAIGVAAIVCVLAWRALEPEDRLGQLLIVQFFGLLASPISWRHHWIWVVPLLIWLVHGRLGNRVGARVLAVAWSLTMLAGLSSLLLLLQPSMWEISRPGALAWLAAINALLAMATLAWVAWTGRTPEVSVSEPTRRSPEPGPHPTP